eukprot:m.74644 g.74644  ORF g.74644 m.74644 type:complete len:368 (-) comp24683_c0_seq1:61-1164(-)
MADQKPMMDDVVTNIVDEQSATKPTPNKNTNHTSEQPESGTKDEGVPKKQGTAIICLGMAGSGKTSFMQRLNAHLHEAKKPCYVVNLDPAVENLPFEANIDIRDTVKYKEVMSQYGLGPNGGIVTSLNLFATKFDQVLKLVEERSKENDYILFDTPGQIEVFTYSASGTIITETLAATIPTVIVYVVDTPRCTSATTFMSNMLYACSILYKARLPFVLAFNKTDVVSHDFCIRWMKDLTELDAALDDSKYMSSLSRSMGLVLQEFYENLSAVGVSAHTGAGMDDFFVAMDGAVKEYHEEYRPLLERLKKEKEERTQAKKAEELEKLRQDSKGSVVLDPSNKETLETPLGDLPEGEDDIEDEEEELPQ